MSYGYSPIFCGAVSCFAKHLSKNAINSLRSLSFTKLPRVRKLMRRSPLFFSFIILLRKEGVKCWTYLVRCKTQGMANIWGFHPSLEDPRPRFSKSEGKGRKEIGGVEREVVVHRRKGDSNKGRAISGSHLHYELLPNPKRVM